MNPKIVKALAVLGVGLAIAAVALAIRATLRAGAIQGPSALLVTRTGEVWLGVDRELWRIGPEGRLLASLPIEAAGLPGPPSNLINAPDGSMVASTRNDSTLHFLDAASARPVRQLRPQWPADLARHGGRAINFAFDGQGRIAIATGGGHAVALFDDAGRFVARSAPELFNFTNGLWWRPEGLWTTDTNRFVLRVLDPQTLAERRAIDLGRAAVGSYLGTARARAGDAGPTALVRLQGDMTQGGVVLVDPQGKTSPLPWEARMEPRDLDWLGEQLLVSDGVSFSILRWSVDGRGLSPFGDEKLQRRLAQRVAERDGLQAWYMRWLVIAVCALVIGALLAAWSQRLDHAAAAPTRKLDLSQLGTPRVGRKALWKLHWQLMGRMLVSMLLPLALLSLLPWRAIVPWLADTGLAKDDLVLLIVGFIALLTVAMLISFLMAVRRSRRLGVRPEFEPALNQMALRLLNSHQAQLASTLRSGEQVLETFMLRPGLAWWVLTSQRLLGFAASLTGQQLATQVELKDVCGLRTGETGLPAARWQRLMAVVGGRIEVEVADGRVVSGSFDSPVLAQRVAARLRERVPELQPGRAHATGSTAASADVTLRTARRARRLRRAVASALLPGLGQLAQRRIAPALVLFAAWLAVMLIVTVPALWTLVEPFTGVTRSDALLVLAMHATLSFAAAADAWRADDLVP